MTDEKNAEEAFVDSINRLVEILRKENLEENDMLLARLRRSRSRAVLARGGFSEENFAQIMKELDVAEAEILRIRSEI